ncbi:DNA helicase, partial [Tanacetum coccineum]
MNDRRCFETLDRTLRDILSMPNLLFGGKSVMLGGDFRQTLPVKKNASHNEIIGSSIAESHLWQHFNLYRLTENMRLNNGSLNERDKEKVAAFGAQSHLNKDSTPTTATAMESYDEALPHGHNGGEVELLYPKEYLNTLSFAGLPPNKLGLKIGSPIILLRNINIVGGLCNGTRLIVKQLLPK